MDTITVGRTPYGDTLPAGNRLPTLDILGEAALSIDRNTRFDIQAVKSGIAGLALTNTRTNAGMAAQLPYYSKAAFSVMDPLNEYNNRDTLSDANNDWWEIAWRFNKAAGADLLTGSLVNTFYSTGPDFDLIFFINVPIMTLVGITTV